MAGSSQTKFKSNSDSVEKLNIEPLQVVKYNIDTVSIICTIDALVKVTGTVTGNLYTFPRPGQPVEVDIRDKDELLNKKRGRSCCGGISGKNLFVLFEGK